jgi:D-alanyl-D-alanine carboxypeptidase
VSTLAHRLGSAIRLPSRRLLALLAGLLVLAGLGALVQRTLFSGEGESRPELLRLIEQPVAGAAGIAPGATAYVSGPHGTWLGAAGIADVKTKDAMRPDARMRLESVGKIYTAALILRLDQLGRLRVTDTVERWLPGLLPYGGRVTIRELLTMSSGIVDDNDLVGGDPRRARQHFRAYLARVKDAALHARLAALGERLAANPATEFSPLLWIRFAAWQPLRFEPGTRYDYSNTNYDLLGLIAERAGGKPIATLLEEQIFRPLGLTRTSYDPQGPIAGPHASGYLRLNGNLIDTTSWHPGKGADGGIVSDAEETGRFLAALMNGTLLDREHVLDLQLGDLWGSFLPAEDSGCAGDAYGWSGGGYGYKTDVWVDDDGSRVAVVLFNGRVADTAGDARAARTLQRLYCAA